MNINKEDLSLKMWQLQEAVQRLRANVKAVHDTKCRLFSNAWRQVCLRSPRPPLPFLRQSCSPMLFHSNAADSLSKVGIPRFGMHLAAPAAAHTSILRNTWTALCLGLCEYPAHSTSRHTCLCQLKARHSCAGPGQTPMREAHCAVLPIPARPSVRHLLPGGGGRRAHCWGDAGPAPRASAQLPWPAATRDGSSHGQHVMIRAARFS